jgi:hypothetical protein
VQAVSLPCPAERARGSYLCRAPEKSVLHVIVRKHIETFFAVLRRFAVMREERGKDLPYDVEVRRVHARWPDTLTAPNRFFVEDDRVVAVATRGGVRGAGAGRPGQRTFVQPFDSMLLDERPAAWPCRRR